MCGAFVYLSFCLWHSNNLNYPRVYSRLQDPPVFWPQYGLVVQCACSSSHTRLNPTPDYIEP